MLWNMTSPHKHSNPARSGAGLGNNLFWDHRTICLMKLMASTMLSAGKTMLLCSSVLPLLGYCLEKFVQWQ